MPHRSSAAALHAARVVLRHFDITVKPREVMGAQFNAALQADERFLSILIDLASNAFRVALMREQVRWWQEKLTEGTDKSVQITLFLERLIEAMRTVPQAVNQQAIEKFQAERPAAGGFSDMGNIKPQAWKMFELSRASIEATKYVMMFYDVVNKKRPPNLEHDRLEIAKCIEVSLGLVHAMKALPIAAWAAPELRAGRLEYMTVRKVMRDIGVHLDQMPHYADLREDTKLLL